MPLRNKGPLRVKENEKTFEKKKQKNRKSNPKEETHYKPLLLIKRPGRRMNCKKQGKTFFN